MPDTLEQIRKLNQQAWVLRKTDRQEAFQLALQVQDLIANTAEAESVDEFECLRTLAYCFDRLSKPAEALSVGLKANALAEQIGDNFLIGTIQGILGRIYWHIDDFPTAMNYYLHALKLVQTENHLELEISLINGLGLVQYGLENYTESLAYFKSCLEKAGKDDLSGQADANNNIAYVLHTLGRDQEALEYGMAGLALHNGIGSLGGMMETLHSLGAIQIALGNYDQAMTLLQQGIEIARQASSQLLEIHYVIEISRILQARGDYTQAEKILLTALETAQQINSLTNISALHERLAWLYKDKQDYQSALEHFQAYHTTYKKVFNDKSDQRIKNLEILHQLEITRKQAELYRELAATDFLTSLVNRRRFFEIAEIAFQRLKNNPGDLTIMMLDIDHFKNVNDRYGHKAGDAVLSTIASQIKKSIRPEDIAGRYGGEEFIVLLLNTPTKHCVTIAERIRQAIAQSPIAFGQQTINVTASIGLVCGSPDAFLILDDLVNYADQALYQAKEQGRNRVVVFKSNEPETNIAK